MEGKGRSPSCTVLKPNVIRSVIRIRIRDLGLHQLHESVKELVDLFFTH